MPMDKNYSRFIAPVSSIKQHSASASGPRKQTLDFLRQFARVYKPVSNMPGLVLN